MIDNLQKLNNLDDKELSRAILEIEKHIKIRLKGRTDSGIFSEKVLGEDPIKYFAGEVFEKIISNKWQWYDRYQTLADFGKSIANSIISEYVRKKSKEEETIEIVSIYENYNYGNNLSSKNDNLSRNNNVDNDDTENDNSDEIMLKEIVNIYNGEEEDSNLSKLVEYVRKEVEKTKDKDFIQFFELYLEDEVDKMNIDKKIEYKFNRRLKRLCERIRNKVRNYLKE